MSFMDVFYLYPEGFLHVVVKLGKKNKNVEEFLILCVSLR